MGKTTPKGIRKRAAKIKSDVAIGKGQVTDGVVSEVDKILEAKEIVKIKFLRSSDLSNRDRMIARLVGETRSELVETRGNTVTLFRARDA
jgi:RNA-binding protein YhbY